MDKNPFISVIIPTFNRAYSLPATIESVLRQSYKNYELIIIDDGSTDNTKDILKSFGNKITYKYQNNGGITRARNAGLEISSGEWVALLDSDDLWYEHKLERHVEDILKHKELDIHITNAHIFREHIGTEVNLFKFIGLEKLLEKKLTIIEKPVFYQFSFGIAWVQCSLIKREILFKVGLYDTNLTIYTDFDLFCRLALNYTWGICSQECVKIKRELNKPNVSAQRLKNPIHTNKTMVYIFDKILNNYLLEDSHKKLAERKLAECRASLGMTYLAGEERKNARLLFIKDLKKNLTIKNLIRLFLTYLPKPLLNHYFSIVCFLRKYK